MHHTDILCSLWYIIPALSSFQQLIKTSDYNLRPHHLAEINLKIRKNFLQKIVVVKDDIIPWTDETGIFYISIQEFLLNRIDRL